MLNERFDELLEIQPTTSYCNVKYWAQGLDVL